MLNEKNKIFIHPSAQVHPGAQLDTGVWVGPFSCIDENVVIQKNTRLDAHVYITGNTRIGENNRFFPYSTIGTEPQDITYKGEKTELLIGSSNVFREFMTIHRGTPGSRGKTVIGNDGYFMAYSHIAHDCDVGNEVILINAATLGGHVDVDDFVTISALSAVHQYCRIGKFAYVGGVSTITEDVVPFCRVAGGRPTLLYGLNAVGLRRKGFSRERVKAIKEMFKILFYSELNTSQALEKIKKNFPAGEDRDEIISFISSSKRGIIKRAEKKWETGSE